MLELLYRSTELIIFILEIPILVLSALLFFEILSACVALRASNADLREATLEATLAVLVPAHNEAAVILPTLTGIKSQLSHKDRLIVIADNCSDHTAALAKSAGAEVVSRMDSRFRGKGYALDFGIQSLESDPPDIVVMIDADCTLKKDAIFHLKQQVLETGLPAQAVYLFDKHEGKSPKDRISLFALTIKNWARPLGLSNLRFNCPMTGSGMAFPWDIIARTNFATNNITEDIKLGLDLALIGYPAKLCSRSLVYSTLPSNIKSTQAQKTRWEHGHLQLLTSYVPKLFLNALKRRNLSLFVMMLDLAIPPLSLLIALWLVLLMFSSILSTAVGIGVSFKAGILSGGLIGLSILMAWFSFFRKELPLTHLLFIPVYILTKLPIYLKFLVRPEQQWTKTQR